MALRGKFSNRGETSRGVARKARRAPCQRLRRIQRQGGQENSCLPPLDGEVIRGTGDALRLIAGVLLKIREKKHVMTTTPRSEFMRTSTTIILAGFAHITSDYRGGVGIFGAWGCVGAYNNVQGICIENIAHFIID